MSTDEASITGAGYIFTAHFSRWRRRWVGRCTCGTTLRPIFRERRSALPMYFMEIHAKASHTA